MACASHRDHYKRDVSEKKKLYDAADSNVAAKYLSFLEKTENSLKSRGQLEALMVVRQEKGRYQQSKKFLSEAPDGLPREVLAFQKRCQDYLARQKADLDRQMRILNQRFVVKLDDLVKYMTSHDKVEGALLVNRYKAAFIRKKGLGESRNTRAPVVPTQKATPDNKWTNPIPQTMRKKLALYYPFEIEDEGETPDMSGKKHTGRLIGASIVPKGKYGSACHFDGQSDYIELKGRFSGSGKKNLTIAVWIKPKTAGKHVCILSEGAHNMGICFGLGVPVGIGKGPAVQTQFVRGGFPSSNMIRPETWTHLACVAGAGSLEIYVNAEKLDAEFDEHLGVKPVDLLNIGREAHDKGRWHFWGLMDELMIFKTELKQVDIVKLYEATGGKLRR